MNQNALTERFAVMNNAYAAYSFEYFLGSLKRLGLTGVDLWGGAQHFNPHTAGDADVRALRAKLKRRGMRVVSYTPELLAYPYNFASPDDMVRRESVRYAMKNLRICAEIESPMMLVSPGWGLRDLPIGESRAWSDECLAALADAAEPYGVKLILEHLTPQSSNLLTSCVAVSDAVRRIGHPMLGAVLDLGQMSLFGETVADYQGALGEKLWHVHIMDGDPSGHLAFGDGVLPLEAYYAELVNDGYDGVFTLEINDGRYAARPHEALKQSLDALKDWGVDG